MARGAGHPPAVPGLVGGAGAARGLDGPGGSAGGGVDGQRPLRSPPPTRHPAPGALVRAPAWTWAGGARKAGSGWERQRLGAATAPWLCRRLLPPPVAMVSPPRSPSYQVAIGFPGEPVAPTSLSGDHVNRNS